VVLVDADTYIFALFFTHTTACPSDTGFKSALQKGLEQWCSQTF